MNGKHILFSAIMTAIVGACLGVLLAEIKPYFYPSRTADRSPALAVMIGGTIGFLAGAAQESVRQMKVQQDREEKLRNYLHTYLHLRDIDNKFDK